MPTVTFGPPDTSWFRPASPRATHEVPVPFTQTEPAPLFAVPPPIATILSHYSQAGATLTASNLTRMGPGSFLHMLDQLIQQFPQSLAEAPHEIVHHLLSISEHILQTEPEAPSLALSMVRLANQALGSVSREDMLASLSPNDMTNN